MKNLRACNYKNRLPSGTIDMNVCERIQKVLKPIAQSQQGKHQPF